MRALGAADPTSVGPFQLLGVLGSGGMGRVYLGTSRTGRRVAIKVIRPDLAEDAVFRDRFTREVAAARRVSPLFTAAVVDADTMAEAPWLATTYIDGVSLDRRVLDDGPMDSDEVLTLAAGLGEALTSIHSVGLVHRDLKPSNILLNESGPHIIDFGLALGSEQTRLTTSLVVGTPSYMAPERLRGEEAGPASDIFSLGATLVFAATGRDLVDDANVYEQVLQIAEARFDLSDVPARMRALVVRCVSFSPDDRPTAAELTRFVVALGAAAPGGGVDDVTVKIATQRRAKARAAGVPVRTTPRRPGEQDTPEAQTPVSVAAAESGDGAADADGTTAAEATEVIASDVVAAEVGAAAGEAGDSSDWELDGDDRTTDGSDESAEPVAASASTTPARSASISALHSVRTTPPGDRTTPQGSAVPAAPPSDRVIRLPAKRWPANGASRNGASRNGTNGAGPNGAGPNGLKFDAFDRSDGEWLPPHPSDPNFGGPPVDLMPARSRFSRRQAVTAGGVVLAVAATGGVLAAVKLAAKQRPGSIGDGSPTGAATPGVGATTSTRPTAPAAITGGSVLWTANSGGGAVPAPNLPGGQAVLVTPSGVIVSLQRQKRRVVAQTRSGNGLKELWHKDVVSSDAALWLWSDGVLVADGQWLKYFALTNGAQRFQRRATDVAGTAIGPNHGLIQFQRVVPTPSTVFVGAGSAFFGMNRSGHLARAVQVGDRLSATPETPTAANGQWLVTQQASQLFSTVNIYPVGSKNPAGTATYSPLAYGVDSYAGKPVPAPPGDDPEIQMVEACLVGNVIVARVGRDVRAFTRGGLTGLGERWHEPEPGPVHAMSPIDGSVLVASDVGLSRYDAMAGTQQWRQSTVQAIRLAVSIQPKMIVAATMGGVLGRNTHGDPLWSAVLPQDFLGAEPTGITINPAQRVAYVTFRTANASSDDVVAVALDAKAHR
ncbi:MAG TPA: protein kinase [Micromonosporaceae bacterium]|nr:protein kinase [Micromonosporaceae bacterium]